MKTPALRGEGTRTDPDLPPGRLVEMYGRSPIWVYDAAGGRSSGAAHNGRADVLERAERVNRRPESTQSAPAFTAGRHTTTRSDPYTAETFQNPEVLMNGEATDRADERPIAPSVTKSFQCRVTYFDDWARVTAKGCLDVSTVPMLRRMVLAAAVLPISGVTLDLAGVDSLDRYAVNGLVTLRRQVRDQSAAFSLASISPPVRRALDVAGVWELFDEESLWSSYPSPDELS